MIKLSIIQRNRNQRNKTWYLRTFDTETKGIRYKSLNTSKKSEALEMLVVEKQILQKSPEEQRLERLPDLKELSEKWLKFIESQSSPLTHNWYCGRIKDLMNFAKDNGVTQFKLFTQALANDLINGRSEVKASTKKGLKAVYSSFFNWIIETYELECKNVFTKVRTPKIQKPIVGFWTLEQIDRILEATKAPRLRLCFAFMAFAGLRINEALSLEWGNIGENHIEVLNGKGGKNERLPIAPRLREEINIFLDDIGAQAVDGGKIFEYSKDVITYKLKAICSMIGIEGKANPHKFRHSFASNLLRNGANIVAVSKLMRHFSPTITLNTYSHVIPDDLGKTLNLLEKKQ